ncbi:hypothetical protein [Thalassomonas sp. RHCl1]|uniref:hypothetical protein n=1 Tax=Thalassomonas sp. RHCl1 TaxID=2995320 RepID=UPI00248D0A40|nr:hypothetical protein [Thalassomonas sp. RHCl1]
MKVNLTRYSRTFVFACLTFFNITISTALAAEAEEFVAKLKTHYQKTLSINAFTLNQHFTNKQYRDLNYWDYKTPNVYMSVRSAEVDLARKHFYDNDILYYAGGRLYDRVKMQNNTESFFYERSATTIGKASFKRGMDYFDIFKNHIVMNFDFLAVRPLFEEANIEENITLHQDSIPGNTTLTHKISDDNVIDYKFSHNPLQLVSINKGGQSGIFVYSDYQTTRGLTYARTVHKYFEGTTEPTYITFNDHFGIIDKVDPGKLQVPEGYNSKIPKWDGVLVSKEIAQDLYLVTDASAYQNSLFKVNGDKIAVYGATEDSDLAEKTIKLILEKFPNKKITSVYVTHPHGDQIDGLKVFVDQGIEILADEYSISAIKAYPRFADDITRFKFQTIEHEQVIDGAHFYVLENMHSKRQSFVYFKDSGIIFQADFLHIPYDNTIAKVIPSYTKTFIDFVRSKQLKVNRIVAFKHNNNISVDIMNKTYDVNM